MYDKVSSLYGEILPINEFLKQPAQWKSDVLGALCFSADAVECRMGDDTEFPCLYLPMSRLDSDDSFCEVWRGGEQPAQGKCGAIRYRHDDDVLFGVIELSESAFSGTDKTPLQQATESAYRQVFELLDTLRYPYLLRFWNYIADINTHSFGLERYRQFNLGRQEAFLAHDRDVAGNVPAACALGSAHGPLSIAFLAGRVQPLSIENPRQISACEYPQQYGPRSPTFSRANLVHMGSDEILFVSGTASIVGHATVHPNDAVAQTRETLTNIEAVLAEANHSACQPFDLLSLNCKAYVRHLADFERVRSELTRYAGSALKVVYLHADICRQDLLLEIEASATHSLTSTSGERS